MYLQEASLTTLTIEAGIGILKSNLKYLVAFSVFKSLKAVEKSYTRERGFINRKERSERVKGIEARHPISELPETQNFFLWYTNYLATNYLCPMVYIHRSV